MSLRRGDSKRDEFSTQWMVPRCSTNSPEISGAEQALLNQNGAMKTLAHHICSLCCWILAKYRIIHGIRKALDHISQT
jgi:hypothetical protein